MVNRGPLTVLSGSSNLPLTQAICEHLSIPLTPVQIERFSNENLSVQIMESIRDNDVFIVQSIYPHPSTAMIELQIMIGAAYGASAGRITVVIPHYSYARSDKKDKPGICVSAKLFARTLEVCGADRFLTMTLHSEHVQGFFEKRIDHLPGTQIICNHLLKRDLSNAVILFDLGQDKRAGAQARSLGVPIVVIDKRRKSDTEVEIVQMVGDVEGKDVIMFDDEIAKGTSVIASANLIMPMKPKSIRAAAVHGLFCGDAMQNIMDSPIDEVIVTDTINIPDDKRTSKLTVLPAAQMFGRAIHNIHEGESLSSDTVLFTK